MLTRQPSSRRGRWVTAAIGVALLMIVGSAVAAFTSPTDNTGNSFLSETLDPPTGLTATLQGNNIRLDWTVTPDPWADGYEVLRSTTQGCCYAFLATVSGQASDTYTDLGAKDGGYYYVVRSTFMNWLSVYSNEASQ